MKHPDYPGVSSITDASGKTRWRFRKNGAVKYLPGQPGDRDFDAAYAKLTGRPAPRRKAAAAATANSNDGKETTFREAWAMIVNSADYRDLSYKTHISHGFIMRDFLAMRVVKDEKYVWGDMPVAGMTDEHLEIIKASLIGGPASRFGRLIPILRRVFLLARKRKWRLDDPTELVEFKKGAGRNGGYIGHKPWPPAMLDKFRAFYPLGTPARTCFEVALWMGNRRTDIGTLDWAQLQWVEVDGDWFEAFVFEPNKEVDTDEDMTQYRPYTAMIREALDHMRKASGPVLTTIGGERPYNPESLSNMMRYWCEKAGIPKGWRLHGLRKSYAMMVAGSGASLWQQKDMLGHTTLQQVQLYARMTDKKRTTRDASKLLEAVQSKPRPTSPAAPNVIPLPVRKTG